MKQEKKFISKNLLYPHTHNFPVTPSLVASLRKMCNFHDKIHFVSRMENSSQNYLTCRRLSLAFLYAMCDGINGEFIDGEWRCF